MAVVVPPGAGEALSAVDSGVVVVPILGGEGHVLVVGEGIACREDNTGRRFTFPATGSLSKGAPS